MCLKLIERISMVPSGTLILEGAKGPNDSTLGLRFLELPLVCLLPKLLLFYLLGVPTKRALIIGTNFSVVFMIPRNISL